MFLLARNDRGILRRKPFVVHTLKTRRFNYAGQITHVGNKTIKFILTDTALHDKIEFEGTLSGDLMRVTGCEEVTRELPGPKVNLNTSVPKSSYQAHQIQK